jgi:hypothetical protein
MVPSQTLRVRASVVACALAVLLVGCSSQRGPDVINVDGLIPITATKLPNVRAYQSPNFERSRYRGMLIEPASVYHGADADFGNVSDVDQERIASLLTGEFKRVLGAQFNLVSEPGPGIVRIKLSLVGINQSMPVLSTALRVTPVGLVMSAAHGVTGRAAPFTGDINVAGVAYDSQTGRVLCAVQALVSPSAVNLTSGLTPLRAAELSTTRAAEAFRDYLNRTQ